MDILIDLIEWIIKQAVKQRQAQQSRTSPPTAQEIDRQKAEVEKRIRDMQTALALQTRRVAPAAQTQRASLAQRANPVQRANPGQRAKQLQPDRRVVRQLAPSIAPKPALEPRWLAPLGSIGAPAIERTPTPLPRQGLIIPLLLGEILAPPLSLRDAEF